MRAAPVLMVEGAAWESWRFGTSRFPRRGEGASAARRTVGAHRTVGARRTIEVLPAAHELAAAAIRQDLRRVRREVARGLVVGIAVALATAALGWVMAR